MKMTPVKSDPHLASDPSASEGGSPLVSIDSAILQDVKVSIEAKLGAAELSMAEFLALTAGSVVTLDGRMNEPIELRLNQSLVARGIIVAVGDHFGVRIVEIAEQG